MYGRRLGAERSFVNAIIWHYRVVQPEIKWQRWSHLTSLDNLLLLMQMRWIWWNDVFVDCIISQRRLFTVKSLIHCWWRVAELWLALHWVSLWTCWTRFHVWLKQIWWSLRRTEVHSCRHNWSRYFYVNYLYLFQPCCFEYPCCACLFQMKS